MVAAATGRRISAEMHSRKVRRSASVSFAFLLPVLAFWSCGTSLFPNEETCKEERFNRDVCRLAAVAAINDCNAGSFSASRMQHCAVMHNSDFTICDLIVSPPCD